ncbi:MAG: hypothetical protein LBL45_10925 [Treponema sp.]|nr:hypothetical protein [Treponema sp.]
MRFRRKQSSGTEPKTAATRQSAVFRLTNARKRKSLTLNNGKEFAAHKSLSQAAHGSGGLTNISTG